MRIYIHKIYAHIYTTTTLVNGLMINWESLHNHNHFQRRCRTFVLKHQTFIMTIWNNLRNSIYAYNLFVSIIQGHGYNFDSRHVVYLQDGTAEVPGIFLRETPCPSIAICMCNSWLLVLPLRENKAVSHIPLCMNCAVCNCGIQQTSTVN